MKAKPKPVYNEGHSPVAFTTVTDRKEMLFEVIKPFEKEIKAGLKRKQLLNQAEYVVLPTRSFVQHTRMHCEPCLSNMKPIYKGQIIIGRIKFSVNSSDGFKNYGYTDLTKDFNIKFVDLNSSASGKPLFILDRNLHLE